ncbi:MAG: universal stress protein [Proteobacteria bacterium]|nr:universal stress protein [Pseudomonadota bacterium]MBU1389641.1 universal stress protein [Pseudomonadota bacterium]MBU1542579.1 universal stress protein [Pseudomonadota bacterium]MBU2479763.1 universal stress protein [Pseudomonadota bacterium]
MIKQINKILFATDLSRSSVDVFEKTVALANQVNASIVIVHVIEDGSGGGGTQKQIIHLVDRDLYEKNRKQSQDTVRNVLIGKQRLVPAIQKALKELCDQNNACTGDVERPVKIDSIEVVYGNAAERIMEIAEKTGCDLISMGYYQHGSILKMITGSHIGKNIIHGSNIPVFLVPLT